MQIVITTNFCKIVFLHSLGRFRPVSLLILAMIERPLTGKADAQNFVFEKSLWNDRFTPDSGP